MTIKKRNGKAKIIQLEQAFNEIQQHKIDQLESQKAALLAACKMAYNESELPSDHPIMKQLKSAIEQAGESGE